MKLSHMRFKHTARVAGADTINKSSKYCAIDGYAEAVFDNSEIICQYTAVDKFRSVMYERT